MRKSYNVDTIFKCLLIPLKVETKKNKVITLSNSYTTGYDKFSDCNINKFNRFVFFKKLSCNKQKFPNVSLISHFLSRILNLEE